MFILKKMGFGSEFGAIVQAYTKHEKGVFSEIAMMRARSYSDFSDSEKLDANKKSANALQV